MEKDDVIEFLDERLAKLREEEPGAFNTIAAYETVIIDVGNEE